MREYDEAKNEEKDLRIKCNMFNKMNKKTTTKKKKKIKTKNKSRKKNWI